MLIRSNCGDVSLNERLATRCRSLYVIIIYLYIYICILIIFETKNIACIWIRWLGLLQKLAIFALVKILRSSTHTIGKVVIENTYYCYFSEKNVFVSKILDREYATTKNRNIKISNIVKLEKYTTLTWKIHYLWIYLLFLLYTFLFARERFLSYISP